MPRDARVRGAYLKGMTMLSSKLINGKLIKLANTRTVFSSAKYLEVFDGVYG